MNIPYEDYCIIYDGLCPYGVNECGAGTYISLHQCLEEKDESC